MIHENLIRLGVFFGLFVVFAVIETYAPRRPLTTSRGRRWITNWGLSIVNTLATRALNFAVPLLAVGAAIDAGRQGFGILNTVSLSPWIEVLVAVAIFDFAIWLQHLVTHKVPLLWRLHRVHHSDRDLDVTTAIRFHPLEIALSMGIKIGLVYVIGPSAIAIILFEVLLNGSAMFNHANIRLPLWLDRIVRLIFVTPDMHRVHHSVHRHEHDSNYGFALSIWDRIFGTYTAQPAQGHQDMQIGLQWQDDAPNKLSWALWLPFRRR